MLSKIIAFSVKQKLIIALFTLVLIALGIYEFTKLPIDAVPDITNNQVQVITVAPSYGATDIELPAPITATASEAIRKAAIAAFKALGCSGLARVDFFLTPSGQVIINELNTMPGFTSTSVFPKMWAASGVSYTEVISHLLQSAQARTNGPLGN